MKKIRCPKCDEPIVFDDSLYTPGRTLVFECPSCRKQFKIRVGGKALTSQYSSSFGTDPEQEEKPAVGYLVVLENAFHLRQIVPLRRRKPHRSPCKRHESRSRFQDGRPQCRRNTLRHQSESYQSRTLAFRLTRWAFGNRYFPHE